MTNAPATLRDLTPYPSNREQANALKQLIRERGEGFARDWPRAQYVDLLARTIRDNREAR